MEYKGTDKTGNNKGKAKILRFFINFRPKVLVVYKKVVPLHSHFKKCSCEVRQHLGIEQALCTRFALTLSPALLGYGVMVTLQILVLSFLVRVRVPQLNKRLPTSGSLFRLMLFVLGVNRFDLLANEVHVILKFLYLAVHLVDEAVAFL